VNGDIVLKRR